MKKLYVVIFAVVVVIGALFFYANQKTDAYHGLTNEIWGYTYTNTNLNSGNVTIYFCKSSSPSFSDCQKTFLQVSTNNTQWYLGNPQTGWYYRFWAEATNSVSSNMLDVAYSVPVNAGNLTIPVTAFSPSAMPVSAPSLTILPSSPNSTSNTLYWNGISDTSFFKVYRRLSGGSWSAIDSSRMWDFYMDQGLAAGTYDYHVNACNSYGCSFDSNIVSGTIGGATPTPTPDTTPPSAPTGLSAVASSPSQINLSWNATTDNVGVTGYKIYRNGSIYWSIWDQAIRTYSDTGLSSNISYSYYVTAFDAANNASPPSATVSATTQSGTISCTGLNLTFQNNKTSYVMGETVTYTYTCSPGGTTSYVEIQVVKPDGIATTYNSASGTISTNTLGFGTSNLVAGNYTLRACFSAGCSSVTASLPFTVTTTTSTPTPTPTPTPTSQPVTVTSPNGGGCVAGIYPVTWSSSLGSEVSYWALKYSLDNGSYYNYLMNVYGYSFRNYNWAIPPDISSSQVKIKVEAISTSGSSLGVDTSDSFLSIAATCSGGMVPAAPTGLTATLNSYGSVELSWTDNSNNELGFGTFFRSPGSTTWTNPSVTANNAMAYGSLTNGTYEFKVRAGNQYGYSADSNIATATVGATPTPTPTPTPTLTPTPTPTSLPPIVDIKVDGVDGTVSRTAPATYTLTWTATNNATTCVPGGTWSTSGNKTAPSGSWYFTGVTVLGLKTYSLTCSNAYGSGSDTVTVDIVSTTVSPTPTPTTSPTPTPSPTVSGSPAPSPSTTPTPTYSPTPTPTPSPTPIPIIDATLVGTVYDSQGKPVSGAWYHVFKNDYSVKFDGSTDSNGSFKLTVLAGSYTAEVFPPGTSSGLLKPQPQSFSILGGETKYLTFKFDSVIKTITGTVLFSNGQPVANAGVRAYSKETGQSVETAVDSSGRYTLTVSGGRWEIGVWPKESSVNWYFSGPYPVVDFSQDATNETRTVNFSIPNSGAKLLVRTLNDQGAALPFSGVVVDVVSAGSYVPGKTSQPFFQKSDNSGLTTFDLKPDAYYIRAFPSDDLSYINPPEEYIFVNSGETKEIKLVFRRKEIAATLSARGTTKLEDGRPVDAFVWAWSEKGGFANARSGSNGDFSLQLTPDERWHFGAGKEFGGLPYKSSDVVISVANISVFVEIVLSKFSETPLSKPATATSGVGQQVVTQTTDGAKLIIPPNAVTDPGVSAITVEVKPTIEAPSQAGTKVIGTAYDVTVKNPAGQELKEFGKEVEFTLPYNESDIKSQGLTEDSISPSYYDDITGNWVRPDNYTIDKEKNVIIVRVKHLTRYAIVAAADITPPADVTSVSGNVLGGGKIKLAWVNPTKDFSHAKIYKSEIAASLGRLAASEVIGTEYINEDVLNGTTYYYTIRSVDPAGNESSSTKQIAVTAVGTSTPSAEPTIYSFKDGDVISATGSDDPDVYIVNIHGYKRLFLNPIIFNFYGHLGGFYNVKGTTPSTRDKFGTSGLFRNCETDDPKVYGVEVTGEDIGTLHWVNTSGEQAVADDANFFKKVFCINNNEFNWYKKGANYTSVNQIPVYSRK